MDSNKTDANAEEAQVQKTSHQSEISGMPDTCPAISTGRSVVEILDPQEVCKCIAIQVLPVTIAYSNIDFFNYSGRLVPYSVVGEMDIITRFKPPVRDHTPMTTSPIFVGSNLKGILLILHTTRH